MSAEGIAPRVAPRLLQEVQVVRSDSNGLLARHLIDADPFIVDAPEGHPRVTRDQRVWVLHGIWRSQPVLVHAAEVHMHRLAAHVLFSFHFFMALHSVPSTKAAQHGFFSQPGFAHALGVWSGVTDDGRVAAPGAACTLAAVTQSPLPSSAELTTVRGEPAFARLLDGMSALSSTHAESSALHLQGVLKGLAVECCVANGLEPSSATMQSAQTGTFQSVLELLWHVYSHLVARLCHLAPEASAGDSARKPPCDDAAAARAAALHSLRAPLQILLPSPARAFPDISQVLTPVLCPARGCLQFAQAADVAQMRAASLATQPPLVDLLAQRLEQAQGYIRLGTANFKIAFVVSAALLHPTVDAVRQSAGQVLRRAGASLIIRERVPRTDAMRAPPLLVIEVVGMPLLLCEFAHACVTMWRTIFLQSADPPPAMSRLGRAPVDALPLAFRRAPASFAQYMKDTAPQLDPLGLCRALANASVACHVFHADSGAPSEAILVALFSAFQLLPSTTQSEYLDRTRHLAPTLLHTLLVKLHGLMRKVSDRSRDYMLLMDTLASEPTAVVRMLRELDDLCDQELLSTPCRCGGSTTTFPVAQQQANRWTRVRQIVGALRVDVIHLRHATPVVHGGCGPEPALLTIGIIDESPPQAPLSRWRAVRLYANLRLSDARAQREVWHAPDRFADQMLGLCRGRAAGLAEGDLRRHIDAMVVPRDPFADALPTLSAEQWADLLMDAPEGAELCLARIVSRTYSDELRITIGQAALRGRDWDPLDALACLINVWLPRSLRQHFCSEAAAWSWCRSSSPILYEQPSADRLHRWLFPQTLGAADADFSALVCAMRGLQSSIHLAAEPLSDVEEAYGHTLHARVRLRRPHRASKLTGMLLQGLSEEEIEGVLADSVELDRWLTEADAVLRAEPAIHNRVMAGCRSYWHVRLPTPTTLE